MPRFGRTSMSRLDGVHPILVDVCLRAVTIMDCSVVYGVRDMTEQRHMVAIGASRTMKSNHVIATNSTGYGHAVDLMPYPMSDWEYLAPFHTLGGVVLAVAHEMGLKDTIRWGGAWRGGTDVNKKGEYQDLMHFEIRPGASVSVLPGVTA